MADWITNVMAGAPAAILAHKITEFRAQELRWWDREKEPKSLMIHNYHSSPEVPISEHFQ